MPVRGTATRDRAGVESRIPFEVGGERIVDFIADDGRVRVMLAMPGLSRGVDISVCPDATLRAVEQAAHGHGMPGSQAEAMARRALVEAIQAAGAWSGQATLGLRALLGGAVFPVLGQAYEAGARAIGEVPRWAAPILAAPTAGEAAQRAFGARATRPVVAAFARSLVRSPSDEVNLTRLALALVGVEVLQADQLAVVLATDGASWPVRLLPDRKQLALGRDAASRWGVHRARRVLHDAVTVDDGRRLFWDTVAYAAEIDAHVPMQLPNDLGGLHEWYRGMIDVAAPPAIRRPPVRRRRRQRSPRRVGEDDHLDADGPGPDRRAPGPRYGLHLAPRTTEHTTVTPDTRIVHPGWLRPVHDAAFGDFRLVLPSRCGDLVRWGRVLHNCLDTYQVAAVRGASHLVGVEVAGRLTSVIELTPQRAIRQFAGPGNRRVAVDEHDTVVDFLRAQRVVR